MPNRILKDSICTSETINAMSFEEEVFWYRLIVQCDDYGRMDARTPILLARCYPLAMDRVMAEDIMRWLEHLEKLGSVQLYSVDGKPYLQITNWDKHQQVRAKRSRYPAMIADDSTCNQMLAHAPENPYPYPNPNPIRESESLSCAQNGAQNDDDDAAPPSPDVAAVRDAYDELGIMLSKTHLDAHVEAIGKYGIDNWRAGFTEAIGQGKANIPRYVARCAESAWLKDKREKARAAPETREQRLAKYVPAEYADIIEH